MLIALFITPVVYPTLAGWLFARVDLNVKQASIAAYLLSVLFFSALTAAVVVYLSRNRQSVKDSGFPSRFIGLTIGLTQSLLLCVLTVAVGLHPINFSRTHSGRKELRVLTGIANSNSRYLVPLALPLAEELAQYPFAQRYLLYGSRPPG